MNTFARIMGRRNAKDIKTIKADLTNKEIQIDQLADIVTTGKNLFNKSSAIVGGYINANGSITTSATHKTSDYIPVAAGVAYTANKARKIAVFDVNKAPVVDEFVDNEDSSAETIIPTVNGYIRVSCTTENVDTMQVEQGNSVTAYEVYYTKFKYQNNAYIETNPLYGKKIVGFGDSIMYGVGNSNIGIPQLLAARNGMTAVNSAIAGATILDVNNSKHVPLQITNSTDTDADYIIINGGVNDVQIEDINTKYGTLSEYYGGGISDTTFVGALELMLKAAKVKWLGKKIVYILVHDMSTRDKTKLDTIVDLTKQACNKWSIPILNLYEEGGLNTRLNDMIAPYTGNSDGTHPNEAGYLTFYIPQLEKKLRSL